MKGVSLEKIDPASRYSDRSHKIARKTPEPTAQRHAYMAQSPPPPPPPPPHTSPSSDFEDPPAHTDAVCLPVASALGIYMDIQPAAPADRASAQPCAKRAKLADFDDGARRSTPYIDKCIQKHAMYMINKATECDFSLCTPCEEPLFRPAPPAFVRVYMVCFLLSRFGHADTFGEMQVCVPAGVYCTACL